MINFNDNVKIEGRYGTWYEVDRAKASDGKEYILFESEQYGDETACILCILPKESDIKRMVGKRTGTEYIMIPKDFEVEETFDNIEDALEQDYGLEVLDEGINEDPEYLSELLAEEDNVNEDYRAPRIPLLDGKYQTAGADFQDFDDENVSVEQVSFWIEDKDDNPLFSICFSGVSSDDFGLDLGSFTENYPLEGAYFYGDEDEAAKNLDYVLYDYDNEKRFSLEELATELNIPQEDILEIVDICRPLAVDEVIRKVTESPDIYLSRKYEREIEMRND